MIIFGDSSFAEIANLYFSRAGYQIEAHIVDAGYKSRDQIANTPVIEIQSNEIASVRDMSDEFFVATTYSKMNTMRMQKYQKLKEIGLSPVSYISPNAFVDPTANIGEHSFIFEQNVIQPFVSVGRNCVIWSGNHVGHHSRIGDHVFVSSHVVISGHCEIGNYCFLGVNSTIANNITINDFCWISPNSLVSKDLEKASITKINKGELKEKNSLDYFGIVPSEIPD